MAAGVAEAERNGILDAFSGRTASYTAPADNFLKLHTGDPGSGGTGNVAANTTRQQAVFASAAASGAISNTSVATWTSVPSAETYSWLSVWSAVTGGTWLGNIQLAVARTVAIGDTFTIPVGDLDYTSTGA